MSGLAAAASVFVLAAIGIGYLVWCGLMIFPLWRVFARAGLAPALSFLFAIPVAGPLVVLLLLAFGDWRPATGSPAGPRAGSQAGLPPTRGG